MSGHGGGSRGRRTRPPKSGRGRHRADHSEDAALTPFGGPPTVESDPEQEREAAAQREADKLLFDALRAEECAGPVWVRAQAQLIKKVYPKILTWIESRQIFGEVEKRIHTRLPGPPPWWQEHDRESLADDTVSGAIIKFRNDAILSGRWSPEGGASLETYFVTGCVYEFIKVYKSWLTTASRNAELTVTTPPDGMIDIQYGCADPEQIICQQESDREFWSQFSDERQRYVAYYKTHGYTTAEIAELMKTTPKAVESLWTRARKRRRSDGE